MPLANGVGIDEDAVEVEDDRSAGERHRNKLQGIVSERMN
jgi:hypothetical protein